MVFFTCFYSFSGYLCKYERALCQRKITSNKSSRKKQYVSAVLPDIKEILEKEMGTSLSDIRDTVNENLAKNFLNNYKIKMFLAEMIGDDIQFCKSYAKNQSLLIFSVKLSMQDVVQRLQLINMYKEVASNLRDILLSTSFDIDDKFGDANELEHSWENITIPEECVISLALCLSFPK